MQDKVLQIVITAKNEAEKTLKGLNATLKENEQSFKNMAKVGAVGFAGIVAIAGTSIKAYAESEAQLARVDQSLKNTIKQIGGDFKNTQKLALDFGASIQKVAGISAEAGAESYAKLLAITGDYAEANKLASLSADLSIAKQIDLDSATKIVSMAMAGNTRVLKEYGIELDEGATKQEVIGALMEKVGGQASAFGQTMQGQTAILKETFGDLQESIGATLTPILIDIVKQITPVIESVMNWVTANPELAKNIILVVGAITGLLAVVGTLGLVLPPLMLGFSLLLGPVGLVVLAITGLIAVGVLLYKNWDTIKTNLALTWEGIKTMFTNSVDFLVKSFDPLFKIIDKVKSAMATISEGVKGAVKKVSDKVKGKATGGGVQVGQSYMVGEKGPEMFTPSSNGSITPNYKMAGAGGINLTINMNGGTYLDDSVAERIGDKIIQQFKRTARI
jgi:hypothetical protein